MDTSGPTVLSVGAVTPDPRNTAVTTIEVEFSEPVDLATFKPEDISLTLDAGSGASTVALTISDPTLKSGETKIYEITDLSAETTAEGGGPPATDGTPKGTPKE